MHPSFQNKRYVIKVIIMYVFERKITDLKIRGVVCYSAFQTFRQSAFRERNENTEYYA